MGPEVRPPQPCMWPQQDGHPSTDGLRPRVPCSASLGTTPRKVSVQPAGMTEHSSSSTQNIPGWRQASADSRRLGTLRSQRAWTHSTHGGDGSWLQRAAGERAAPERDMHFTPPLKTTTNKHATENKTWALCSLRRPLPCPRMSGQHKSPGPGSLSAEPRSGPGSTGWGLLAGDWPEGACLRLSGEEGAKGQGCGRGSQEGTGGHCMDHGSAHPLAHSQNCHPPNPRCEMCLQTGREITTRQFLSSDECPLLCHCRNAQPRKGSHLRSV